MVCGLLGTASTYALLTVFIFVFFLNITSVIAAFLVTYNLYNCHEVLFLI